MFKFCCDQLSPRYQTQSQLAGPTERQLAKTSFKWKMSGKTAEALLSPPPTSTSCLPAELLHQIFLQLSTRDLQRAVLVCQLWREVGKAPVLWTWGVVRVTGSNMAALPSLLARDRLQHVRELRVERCNIMARELLDALVRHRGLRKVVFNGVGMSSVAPGQLARALGGLQEVDIVDTFLDGQQIEAVLGAINRQIRLDIRNTKPFSQVDYMMELFDHFCDHIGFMLGQLFVGTKYQIFTRVMCSLGVTGYIMVLCYFLSCYHISTSPRKHLVVHTFKAEDWIGVYDF